MSDRSDRFVRSVRQVAELDHAFERNGWTPAEVRRLSQGDTLSSVRRILVKHAFFTPGPEHIIDCNAFPFVPSHLELALHQKGGQFKWDKEAQKDALWLSKAQVVGKQIKGVELRQELANKKVLNANVLDYLLTSPFLIPEEWKGKNVFFWGTIYCFKSSPYVRCLIWSGHSWDWRTRQIARDWDGLSPAAVPAI